MSETITAEILREYLSYDPTTGQFSRIKKTWRSVQLGDASGHICPRGYLYITVLGHKHRAHRLAWLWYYGRWPVLSIDHINGDKMDNRIQNLREVTHSQNKANAVRQANNTSGVKGVYRKRNKWQAAITFKRRRKVLGVFDRIEDAASAYAAASAKIHGEFGRLD